MTDPARPEAAGDSDVDPSALEERLGYDFQRPQLLRLALRHRSWCAEHGGVESNERLEFLGDAVLGLEIARRLYLGGPDLEEGDLARLRAELVNARALADVARDLDLGASIQLGRGEESTDGRDKNSILADAMEAVIGAVYLDGGPPAAAALVDRWWSARIDGLLATGALSDHKSRLQEEAARRALDPPRYALSESGPDHAKHFIARVRVGGPGAGSAAISGTGEGRTKKDAEQAAAADALARLALIDADSPASAGDARAGNGDHRE